MYEQHRRTIEKLVELFQDDPRYLALLIGGSVAKGRARPDSDVDIVLVATEEEYRRRRESRDVLYWNQDICDYPGGYVDGKVVDMPFLMSAAERGSEPTRSAFVHTFIAFSRLPELEGVLRQIPVYQEQDQAAKIEAFFTRFVVSNWYVKEAQEKRSQYLLTRFASDLVLFGGRLILAHNKILYPYHKWFLYELERAPEKPENLMSLVDSFLQSPSVETAGPLYESIRDYRDWGLTEHEAFRLFTDFHEFGWRSSQPAVEDW